MTHDNGLLRARNDGTSELPRAMMRQDTMHDSLRLFLAYSSLFQDVLQPMSADVDVAEQVHIWLALARFAVLIELTAIVEEYRDDAMLHRREAKPETSQ